MIIIADGAGGLASGAAAAEACLALVTDALREPAFDPLNPDAWSHRLLDLDQRLHAMASGESTAVVVAWSPQGLAGEERVRACYQHCCLCYVTNARMTNQTLRERFKLEEAQRESISRVIRETMDAGKVKLDETVSKSKRYARYRVAWSDVERLARTSLDDLAPPSDGEPG